MIYRKVFGKIGRLMNKALPPDRLKGAVFGEPITHEYHVIVSHTELLEKYKAAIVKRREGEAYKTESRRQAGRMMRIYSRAYSVRACVCIIVSVCTIQQFSPQGCKCAQ